MSYGGHAGKTRLHRKRTWSHISRPCTKRTVKR
nr:MAG TPA: hypothetical protein [Caudoviricetes sp.]